MGSEVDDILINIDIDGFTTIIIEGVETINGRRRVNLTIKENNIYYHDIGTKEATLRKGDQFNLNLSIDKKELKKAVKKIKFRKWSKKERMAFR